MGGISIFFSTKNICNYSEFEKYRTVLEKINSERVFSIQNKNDEFWLVEECDEYFLHELTKQDCLELSELFSEIAKLIKE